MSGIDFNNESEYISQLSVFNDGNPGIVENVEVRVEVKPADAKPDDKKPNYKFIAKDKYGEINEGFYYFESSEDRGFKNYQAQRLIMLAKGVVGDDVKFPVFNTPREALDRIMQMVAKECKGKFYRVLVTYGTTQRPDSYLRFKSFGRFIEPMTEPCTLKLEASDNLTKKPFVATDETLLVQQMSGNPDIPNAPVSESETDIPKADESANDLPF